MERLTLKPVFAFLHFSIFSPQKLILFFWRAATFVACFTKNNIVFCFYFLFVCFFRFGVHVEGALIDASNVNLECQYLFFKNNNRQFAFDL